ncbi:MAG: DUF58 domain-containing protein [Pseudoclavibacter sp.]|nr:DUF58 domain-containing protein [Pseudoclavibacter sp.]
MAVTGRFVVLLALGLLPVVLLGATPDGALLVLAAWILLCLAVALADLALAASPRRIRLEREEPGRVRLGERSESRLYLTNTGSRALRGLVRDAWDPTAGAPRMREPVSIPPGERRAVRTPLRPVRRGTRRARHVTVRSFGPLRLFARQATLQTSGTLLVLPPFRARRHLPSRLARLREMDGQTQLMIRGQGTEFDSLREYVRGDDVRSIDWRATARRQELVVRNWRPERDRRVLIVLDAGRVSAARIGDETRLDASIESSLLLAALADRAGDRVDLLSWERRVRARVQGVSGAALLPRMVEAMADVEPELIETDWQALPGLVRGVTSRRSLVVVLTTLESAGTAEEFLDVLPQLTRSHLVVVAGVTDPGTALVAQNRSSREAVYRAAAAERAMLDRERVRAAMNRLGAEVVSAPPEELPPALADRYLALKAAGRL